MDTFRVRLNCIDSYQAVPNEFDPPVPLHSAGDHAKDRPKVSVIRVFGATETGQKVLMHIHGAFQYTYIEYGGSLIPEDVNVAIRTLHLSIDHALAVSYRKNIYDCRTAYVAHISLVKGIPFYGFHVGYKFYLKIYLLNPLHMTRLADLLREGAVMKRVLQPYESHMQYLAQWMCDYNLYGCAYIDCQKVKFRAPIPKYLEMNLAPHQWHDRSIPPDFVSDEAALPKQSHSSLEVDVCVQDILNRRDVENRPLHHDFIEKIHPLPADAKWVPSMAGLWKDETRRRKALMSFTDPNSSPFPPEVLITMSADPRNTEAGGWVHEEEFRAKAARIAAEEFEKSDKRMLTFDTYVRRDPLEDSVKTALESIGDLWPENLARGSAYDDTQTTQTSGSELANSQVLVDENRVREVTGEYPSDSGEMHFSANGEKSHRNGHQTTVIQPSSARDKSDSDLEVTPPISSSEFEKLGVRKQGDSSHIEEDTFRIPAEYARREANVSGGNKRTLPSSLKIQPPKRKRLTDEDNLLPDFAPIEAEDDGSSYIEPSTSRRAGYGGPHPTKKDEDEAFDRLNPHGHPEAANPLSEPQGTTRPISLAFPIVKDPNDPNTILRLSQQSSSPDKSSQDRRRTGVGKITPAKSSFVSSQKTPTSAATASSLKSLPGSSILLRGLSKPVSNRTTLIFQQRSPSMATVKDTMLKAGLPDVIYQEAFYSNEDDVPDRQREYAGREFKLESATVPFLPDFDPAGRSPATLGQKVPILIDQAAEEKADSKRRRWCKLLNWSISDLPPSKSEVVAWLEEERRDVVARRADLAKTSPIKQPLLSQIDGPTQKNKYGFKYSQKQPSTRPARCPGPLADAAVTMPAGPVVQRTDQLASLSGGC